MSLDETPLNKAEESLCEVMGYTLETLDNTAGYSPASLLTCGCKCLWERHLASLTSLDFGILIHMIGMLDHYGLCYCERGNVFSCLEKMAKNTLTRCSPFDG